MTCQSCHSPNLEPVLSLGLQPLCNALPLATDPPGPVTCYPLDLVRCAECTLVQLSYVPPAELVFPSSYPYRSGTTKQLRENFKDLAREVLMRGPGSVVDMAGGYMVIENDLAVDIGSNDGTLLSCFKGRCRVLGVTPEATAASACSDGIETIQAYFNSTTARVVAAAGSAKVITCTNCFAHVPDPNDFLEGVTALLADDGVFVSEHTHWLETVRTGAYDSAYSEHARYYTLEALAPLLARHGLTVFHVKRIPTHGGSIRVYASRKPSRIDPSVQAMLDEEREALTPDALRDFAAAVRLHRLDMHDLFSEPYDELATVHGIGAPSRASTLINYCGITADEVPVIYETAGSAKIGCYMPGTSIRVVEEPREFGDDQPTHLLLLSWHIRDTLTAALRAKGFRGKFIAPLPNIEVFE